MKKQILISMISLSSILTMNAQWQSNGNNIFNNNTGYVGIGTDNPSFKLDVIGGDSRFDPNFKLLIPSAGPSYFWKGDDGMDNVKFSVWDKFTLYNPTSAGLNINNSGWNIQLGARDGSIYTRGGAFFALNNGNVSIGSVNSRGDKFHVNTGGQFFRVMQDGVGVADAGWQHTLIFSNFSNYSEIFNNIGKPLVLQKQNGGNVGIGTNTPDSRYKLDVIGTIRAREIKVDLEGADFVFEDTYKLMPLNELEKFVKEQKHLPEIAPANEMEKNGTNLGVLTSKLLQKIEELTLYTIEQNKKIIELEKQNKSIEELKQIVKLQNEKMEKIVATLK